MQQCMHVSMGERHGSTQAIHFGRRQDDLKGEAPVPMRDSLRAGGMGVSGTSADFADSLFSGLIDRGNINDVASLPVEAVQGLLDQFPGTPFFIKDPNLRYAACNGAMVEFCGAKNRAALIGKTAAEFFLEPSYKRAEALEATIMRTGKPITNRLELSLRKNGGPVWAVFGFWPFSSLGQGRRGVVAVGRVLNGAHRRHRTYEGLARAIDYIHTNYHAPVALTQLAHHSGLSPRQLDANFVELFGLPPLRYLTRVRLEAASELLAEGRAIAEVAHACGYSDQSAFTRRFRAAVGMSPSEYRKALVALNG